MSERPRWGLRRRESETCEGMKMEKKQRVLKRTYKQLTIGAGGAWHQYAFGGGGGVIVKTGEWRSFRPIIDSEKCTKCRICALFCPDMSILETEDGSFTIDYDYCKGCGICANECTARAIRIVREDECLQ